MNKNESTLDRVIRAVVSIIILYAAYTMLTGIVALIVYIIGVLLMISAITGYCHLYKIIGKSTLKQ